LGIIFLNDESFECNCVLDKDKIGFGKGNSKQGAKTESAIEGVRTLLTKDQFTYEKAHITLSVQKSKKTWGEVELIE